MIYPYNITHAHFLWRVISVTTYFEITQQQLVIHVRRKKTSLFIQIVNISTHYPRVLRFSIAMRDVSNASGLLAY